MSFVREFMGDVFAFDSRFWRSMPALLWKPGTMVREYVGGRHAAYVPPFRMYVFVSFVFFYLLDITANREIESKKEEFKLELARDSVQQATQQLMTGDSLSVNTAETQKRKNNTSLQSLNIQIEGQDSLQTQKKLQQILANPVSYVAKFNKNLSWSLFLLMPLLGFFFWLTLRKNRPFYVPHFLFAIQLHTVLFLLLIVFMSTNLLWSYLFWLLPAHAIAGARKLFGLGWFSTFWRLTLATACYLICVLASATLMAISIFNS
jgi:hypothetical protein